MIVCSCRSVSDRDLRAALADGASPDEVLRRTAAGSDCGCCREQLAEILARAEVAPACCSGPPCPGCPRRGSA